MINFSIDKARYWTEARLQAGTLDLLERFHTDDNETLLLLYATCKMNVDNFLFYRGCIYFCLPRTTTIYRLRECKGVITCEEFVIDLKNPKIYSYKIVSQKVVAKLFDSNNIKKVLLMCAEEQSTSKRLPVFNRKLIHMDFVSAITDISELQSRRLWSSKPSNIKPSILYNRLCRKHVLMHRQILGDRVSIEMYFKIKNCLLYTYFQVDRKTGTILDKVPRFKCKWIDTDSSEFVDISCVSVDTKVYSLLTIYAVTEDILILEDGDE